MSVYKTQCISNINTLIPKLSEDELEHLFNYVKDILKLPRTTKTLSSDITIYLQLSATILDDTKTYEKDNTVYLNRYLNELNTSHKNNIKNYFLENYSVIDKLLDIKNNHIKINDEDTEGLLNINYTGKVENNYYSIYLNKFKLNTIEDEYYKSKFSKINKLYAEFDTETDFDKIYVLYKSLHTIVVTILSNNNLKIPKELKKIETSHSKINDAVNKMKTYTPDTFDIKFRRSELYSIKDILEQHEETVFSFKVENFIYNVTLSLKKMS